MGKIRVLELSGSYYEMGYKHGEAYRHDIIEFTEDRVQLCSSDMWTGRGLSRDEVLKLAQACVEEHQQYSPELMEELQGTADATGLSLAELIINNGFTDFIDTVYTAGQRVPAPEYVSDNCTAFLVSNDAAVNHQGMFGQTWDMHDTATPYIIMLDGKPDGEPAFMCFTITGCVGMIGMNDAGIAIGINNLSAADGQVGVTWPFVIRKALMQTNIDDALDCITSAKLAGAHNYLLMDKQGNGYNVEAMSTRYHVDKLNGETLIHTNHCLIPHNIEVERARPADAVEGSSKRLSLAKELLHNQTVTPEMLMALTRDERAICVRPQPPRNVESCGAAIMRPATGDFWAVWGLPVENEYEHFKVMQ